MVILREVCRYDLGRVSEIREDATILQLCSGNPKMDETFHSTPVRPHAGK